MSYDKDDKFGAFMSLLVIGLIVYAIISFVISLFKPSKSTDCSHFIEIGNCGIYNEFIKYQCDEPGKSNIVTCEKLPVEYIEPNYIGQ